MTQFRKFSARQIYTNLGDPVSDRVVVIDDKGTILAIGPTRDHDPVTVEKLDGIIVPGFVNAHCHLELSHMKGKVPTGTGLVKFIEGVVSMRDADPEEIDQAIHQADREMYQQGIVAVGDICNRADTFAHKENSDLFYYSFVEMFDFLQDHLAGKYFGDYRKIYDQVQNTDGHRKSAVPHAPYSVSQTLFKLINQLNEDIVTVSIHNQETAAEDLMFRNKEGEFLRFFSQLGFSFEHFRPSGKSSVHYALENLDARHRHLFVHNTMTTSEDVRVVHEWNNKAYWVSCPNANLYIENRLPNYQIFLNENAAVCLGTDSLTSNWQLSILEEMKTIARYQSYVPMEALIQWATLNGALALGVEDRYGSIEEGKRPGLNLITVNQEGLLDSGSTVRKLC